MIILNFMMLQNRQPFPMRHNPTLRILVCFYIYEGYGMKAMVDNEYDLVFNSYVTEFCFGFFLKLL